MYIFGEVKGKLLFLFFGKKTGTALATNFLFDFQSQILTFYPKIGIFYQNMGLFIKQMGLFIQELGLLYITSCCTQRCLGFLVFFKHYP